MAIPYLKKYPESFFTILPILDNLKTDASEYVRRSVANNLNDIAKDNPEIVISIAMKWQGISKETDAIIKHGCRTHLKQGNTDVLNLFGLFDSTSLEVSNFKIHTPKINIGADLSFSFTVENCDSKSQIVRLEYAVYFLRQNGQLSKKVFKISEHTYQPDEKAVLKRKQSFKIITTRKYHPGYHRPSIIINGQ